MRYAKLFLAAAVLILVLNQCNKDKDNTIEPHVVNTINDMKVSGNFDFKTSKDINVSFSDSRTRSTSQVKYDIYLYDDQSNTEDITYLNESGETVYATVPVYNVQNDKIATVISSDNTFNINITVPQYYTKLYIVRNELGHFSSTVININQNRAAYKRVVNRSTNTNPDIFYAVNGNGDLLTIDEESGNITKIGDLPNSDGSWACAIDPVSRKLYTIAHSNGENLYSYDIDNNSWETIGSVGISGSRLGYNVNNGLLYFSTNKYLYTIDPSNANVLTTYKINGWQNTSGGDITFDEDGTMFMSSTRGIYWCEFRNGNKIKPHEINSDLPDYPNSLTFSSNGELWWSTTNNNTSNLYIIDKANGNWNSKFSSVSYVIEDLATLPFDENAVQETDTDGDGVIDIYDEYPNDANKVSTTYTPSVYGWGSYAFEDLWPYQGDYDFNDLVINYRYTNFLNADGLLVETLMSFYLKNVGGSYKNGFGIEMNMNKSLIDNVTGYNLTEGIIQTDASGLEMNQDKPVIIVFDNAWENTPSVYNMEISVVFSSPVSPNTMTDLNPFIFIDGERGREVHLSNKAPTSLANFSLLGSAEDNSNASNNIYYKNANNLPWAIDIYYDFVPPKEKKEIILGYPHFVEWAESTGNDYNDWFQNGNGYRNYNYLKQD